MMKATKEELDCVQKNDIRKLVSLPITKNKEMNKGYENENILFVFLYIQRTKYIQVLYPFQVQLNKENKIKLL